MSPLFFSWQCAGGFRRTSINTLRLRDRVKNIARYHSGTEVVLVREGPRAGGGSSQRKKGSDYFTSPVKTMTLRDIK